MEIPPGERAELWRLLFITMIRLLNTVEADLKRHADLTLLDIGCLFALANAGRDGRSMGSLAALFGVDPSVITYRARRLESQGLATREADPGNRRFVRLQLTDHGRRALRQARQQLLSSADDHFFAYLQPADLSPLRHVLGVLHSAQHATNVTA